MIETKHKQTGRVLLRVNIVNSLAHADLHGLQLGGADLRGADLGGVNFSPWFNREDDSFEVLILAGLLRVNHAADLSDAGLTGANLEGAYMQLVNLSKADLKGANLKGACLAGSDLTGANLTGTDLRETHFAWIRHDSGRTFGNNLTYVIYDEGIHWPEGFDPKQHGLVRATPKAELRNVKQDKLWLCGMDLSNVDLRNASLVGTDLSGAWLCGTILTNADLTDTVLTGARYDFHTVWPPAFDPLKHGAIQI